MRSLLLVRLIQALAQDAGKGGRQLAGAEQVLNLITGLYDRAAKQAAARRH